MYNLKQIKKPVFYFGTGRLYLEKTNSQVGAICKARAESKNGDSVNVYIEGENAPLQMIRAYKNGALEYTAEKIQTK